MKRVLTAIAIIALGAAALSCRSGRKGSSPSSQAASPQQKDPTIFERLDTSRRPHMLSPQVLTSEEAYLRAFESDDSEYEFLGESTPAEKTFLLLDGELGRDSLARLVQLHYNYASVLNRVLNSYEWYCRMASDVDDESGYTRKDTLEWISASQPVIPVLLLRQALPDPAAFRSANRLLAAYRAFDGDDSKDSDFAKAYRDYLDLYKTFPKIVTDNQVKAVKEGFWKWYDKSSTVPGVNELIRTHLHDSREYIDSLQVDLVRQAAERAYDLDTRAVLALELVQHDRWNGSIVLGDILECGIYTKYLLEAWVSWRANLQMEHSPSSFSVIANNYFDMLRVQCLKTYLRYLREQRKVGPEGNDTLYDRCMMVNLIQCDIVHRMASIAGNESFATRMHLAYDMFIDPSLIEE